ncbi:unnamed protein product [Mytilus edulis]|uniref:Uncharacterized protein n=1 Tax=Mytilus edulis TaxID=6550 RepID=A0A8S3RT34_MYTED|nr:unnamed protein product [Mytilus edulis]
MVSSSKKIFNKSFLDFPFIDLSMASFSGTASRHSRIPGAIEYSIFRMFTYSFATVIVAFVVYAYGHDCTKYSLTPSDQSLIDMMKHYLHTSRKADCPVTPSQQDIGVTYVRWGKKTCAGNTDIVYAGQAGGNYYTNKGGGSNYLCLPSDPENGKEYSYANNVLYGAEYQIDSSTKPSGLSVTLLNKEVPCAVCRRRQKNFCFNDCRKEVLLQRMEI